MKVYKSGSHVYVTYNRDKPNEFAEAVLDRINDMQIQGLQIEVQYKPIYLSSQILFSALILGYTEE